MKLVASTREFSLISITMLMLLAVGLPANAPRRSAAGQDGGRGLELVGHTNTGGMLMGDIWVHSQFAYLGTASCGDGVQVVDISDPANPKLIRALVADNASRLSTHGDVAVINANTRAFHGDLLAVGIQSCGSAGAHGVQFWDVTNPGRPKGLGFFDTGEGTDGVHELYVFQRDNRIFALLAVPFSEEAGAGGDFRIIEATNPNRLKQIADWGIQADLGVAPETLSQGGYPFTVCHSAWANEAGTVAYLSYWDAGVVMLNIADPNNPQFIGRTMYAPDDEGNAHSVWRAHGGSLLLVGDEDFAPGGTALEVIEPQALAGPLAAIEGDLTRQLCNLGEVSGEVIDVEQNPLGSNAQGKIALIDASFGGLFSEQILRAERSGAIAVIVINPFPDPIFAMEGNVADIPIPSVMISQDDGHRLFDALFDGETVRVRLTPDPNHTWGFLRIYDLSDPANPKQISTFATERTRQCPSRPASFAPDAAWFTIHNPFVVGYTAYLSWYSDGVRVVDISDPSSPRETGFFIPDDPRPMVWGVYVQDDLVFLSDLNSGLYILRQAGQ